MNSKKILWHSVMTVIIILLAVFAFLVIETKYPEKLSGDMSGYSDVELAEIAVREFIGNSSVILEYKGTEETVYGDFYEFSTADGGMFYVDSVGFEISRARFPSDWNEMTEVKISLEDAEGIARDFIAEKTPRSEVEKLETIEGKLQDHGSFKEYSFTFNEIEDGVELLKYVHVALNPSTGDVISYIRLWRETEVSLVPAISDEEALKIAEDQFEGIVVTESDAWLTIQYPEENKQRLTWLVQITGEPKDFIMVGGLVSIDAQTGKVYQVAHYA